MGYDLTVQGLIRKRAEMAGQVTALQARLGELIAAMSHIDASIRVFRPDIELDDLPERLAPAPFTGFRGEIQRFLLDELRKANHPLSTFDLAKRVMVKRGLDPDDKITFKLIAHRTGYSLSKLRRVGKVTSRRVGHGAPLEWELTGKLQDFSPSAPKLPRFPREREASLQDSCSICVRPKVADVDDMMIF
jgi:hypothetical protein